MIIDSKYLPVPPEVPGGASYARKIAWDAIPSITDQEVFAVPLADGQPYRLTVANLPITGPAGPGPISVTVFERIGFETLARAEFTVGHGQAQTYTGIGPVRVVARQLVLNTNPSADFFLTIHPEVKKDIPPLSSIETIGGAFATIALNAGFPPAYRTKLTLGANGNFFVRGIDNAGVVVTNINVTGVGWDYVVELPWNPQLRVQLGPGAAPAATSASVVWTQ